MVQLHDRVIVLLLHGLQRVFKFFLQPKGVYSCYTRNLLGGLHFAKSLLLIHLVVKFLAQRIALNLLLGHHFLHLAGDLALAHLHVSVLLLDLHLLDLGLKLVSLRVLFLLNELLKNLSVVQELHRWLVNLAQLLFDQLSALS